MDFELSLGSEAITAAFPDAALKLEADATIAQAMDKLSEKRSGAILICNPDETLLGIFTERDALRLMTPGSTGSSETDWTASIQTVMSKTPETVKASESVGSAIQKMSRGGYRHLPILAEDGKPVGIAAVKGLVHYLVDHFPATIYNLPPSPNPVTTEREGA